MKMRLVRKFAILISLVSCSFISPSAIAQDESDCSWFDCEGNLLPFTNNLEAEQFILTAQPVSSETIRTGVNKPKKVLLENNGVEAHCIFRFQRSGEDTIRVGGVSRYLRDSYSGEIAAYSINHILGMDNIPPTACRELHGCQGTIQLWLEGAMSELDRRKKRITPPDAKYWNRQSYDMRVFDNLINNIDRNQTNILIDKDWKIWLIDHTRSFSRDKTLPNPEKVIRCSRSLWEAIQQMDETVVRESLEPYLSELEVNAFFMRRTKLIQLIEKKIEETGEEKVLFD